MKKTIENNSILICDSHHGIYMPQITLKTVINCPLWNFTECGEQDINDVLEGPDNENYWDAWIMIEQNVKIFDNDGNEYILVQNEDLWAIPIECINDLEDWLI